MAVSFLLINLLSKCCWMYTASIDFEGKLINKNETAIFYPVGNAANTARYPATLAALPTGTEEDSSRKTNKLGNKLAAETFNVDISASELSTGKNKPFCICE